MAKHKLSDREVALVKGLIAHEGFNDQQALSVFTYLDRNINHREIGSIRRGDTQRYVGIAAASQADTKSLLRKYQALAAMADRLGLCEMESWTAQVHKCSEIMKTAVMIYNNNVLGTRSETFIVLAVIAWTYAIHVWLRQQGIEPVYADDAGEPVLIEGREKLWDLSNCISKPEAGLSKGAHNNLRYILAVRHEVEHRSCEDINEDVQAKIQANALNFVGFVREKFGDKFDISQDLAFTIQLQSLLLNDPNSNKGNKVLSKAIAAVNALIEGDLTQVEYDDPAYSYRVYVVPKVSNNQKNSDQAVSYSAIGSPVEIAIKQVERPKYRQTEAINLLKAEGKEITAYQFQQTWAVHNLKAPAKGLAIELGKQWFWYREGLDRVWALFETTA